MRKLLMALTILGLINYSAEAQQKESKFAKNYEVCKYKKGYNICTKEQMNAQLKTYQTSGNVDETLPAKNEIVYVRCRSMADEPTSYRGPYKHHNIIVDDEMDNPYKGKPSRQYDGPEKNRERNINENQTSIELPPSNGYTTK